jgi:hypothetical protein
MDFFRCHGQKTTFYDTFIIQIKTESSGSTLALLEGTDDDISKQGISSEARVREKLSEKAFSD